MLSLLFFPTLSISITDTNYVGISSFFFFFFSAASAHLCWERGVLSRGTGRLAVRGEKKPRVG